MSTLESLEFISSLNDNYNAVNNTPKNLRFRQRRSLDYGYFYVGNNVVKCNNSLSSSPIQVEPNKPPKNLIRRQSSEKCLQKRYSVDSNRSNNSDPGLQRQFTVNQLRSSSNSPKLYTLNHCNNNNNFDENPTRKWYSSSSMIVTRVKSMKDKLRRAVVQSVTPDDWPPPSVLFSDKYYRYPSNNLIKEPQVNSTVPTNCPNLKTKRASFQNIKSKSIDQSNLSSNSKNKSVITNPRMSNLQLKRSRLQRSMTSYTGNYNSPVDSSISSTATIPTTDNGVVCTNLDLKDIINNFQRDEIQLQNSTNHSDKASAYRQSFISKTPTFSSSTSIGPGFGKRKIMRKQVSFDDEQGVMVINRKVSAIAEEIEQHLNSNHQDRKQPTRQNSQSQLECIISNEIQAKSSDTTTNDEQNAQIKATISASNLKEDGSNIPYDENADQYNAAELPLLNESNPNEITAKNTLNSIPCLPKEVEFDEFGQTWEIYGADPDPEILGQAIQEHLERLMSSNIRSKRSESLGSDTNKPQLTLNQKQLKSSRVDFDTSNVSDDNQLRLIVRRLCSRFSCLSTATQQNRSNTRRSHSTCLVLSGTNQNTANHLTQSVQL